MELALELEREKGTLGLRCRVDLGFQSRGVYIRKGWGADSKMGGMLRGAVERFLVMFQGGVVGEMQKVQFGLG